MCLFVQGETRCSLTDKWTESSCPPTDLVYADTHGCDCRSRRTCSAESSETQTSHQGPSSVACFSLAKSIKAIEWIDDAGINHIVYGTLCSDSSETVSCNASQLLLTSQPRFQSIPRHLHGSIWILCFLQTKGPSAVQFLCRTMFFLCCCCRLVAVLNYNHVCGCLAWKLQTFLQNHSERDSPSSLHHLLLFLLM